MRNFISKIAIFLLFSKQTNAQVNLAGANSGNGLYTTLAAAFTAINADANQTGRVINITITGNTTEPAAGATLNSGSWTSLSVNPSGGATRTITGAVTAGSSLIKLNGADNVTINGLNTAGNSLILSNTTVSGSVGTSTIKFMADASNNTITNCTVLGSYTANATTSGDGGTIDFFTGTTTGNDNNTISYNNIGPAGANLPSRAIGAHVSTSTTLGYSNDNITISNNNIYDFFSNTLNSSGIYIHNWNNNWSINDNKFYQTAQRTLTPSLAISVHSAIRFFTSGYPTNMNCTITGNTIGYATSTGTGVYDFVGNGSNTSSTETSCFVPIHLKSGTSAGALISIQNNTITAIKVSGTCAGTSVTNLTTSMNSPLRLIYIEAGIVKIGDLIGNTFGDLNSNGAISFTSSNSAYDSDVYGVFHNGASNVTCSNNSFGGITAANTGGRMSSIYCIRGASSLSTSTFTVSNNIIGGTVANSIQSTSSNASTRVAVAGIYTSGSIGVISENTVRNLTAAGGTGITTLSSVLGICAVFNSIAYTITHNTIYSLTNTNTTDATTVTGIHMRGGSGSIVNRNFVRSLSAANSTGIINGINIHGDVGNIDYINNMISLGKKEDGTTVTVPCQINGINYPSTTSAPIGNFYFNSINVCGNGVTNSANNSFAFNSLNTSTQIIKNNIFYNQRSNASTGGKHYAVKVAGTSGLTIDYNDYQTTGTGGILGNINAGDITTLAGWQGATGQDVNSITPFSPLFISDNDLHLQSAGNNVLNAGLTIAGIIGDIDNDTRVTPTIGADEITTVILPIELIDFNANCSTNKILITWTTATETNNDSFILEKSLNGIDFKHITKVPGKGNSLEINQYNFLDEENNSSIVYYRLKQIDFTGQSTTSNNISITPCNDNNGNIKFLIFPNPTIDDLTVSMDENIQTGGNIEITNYLGQKIFEQSFSSETNKINLSLNNRFSSGVYFIVIKANNEILFKQKIIKN